MLEIRNKLTGVAMTSSLNFLALENSHFITLLSYTLGVLDNMKYTVAGLFAVAHLRQDSICT